MIYDNDVPKIYKEINSDNYLLNSYKNITRVKEIHFILILIELLLNIIQELETFVRGYRLDNNEENLNLVSFIIHSFDTIPSVIKLISFIGYIIIFEGLYFLIKLKKFKLKYILISVLVNTLELFINRVFMLIFLNFFFTLKKEFFIIGCIIIIPHIYLIMENFSHNHLYYFVPEFIEYPYDEFSSLFDSILIVTKILISASSTTNNVNLGTFFFLILFCLQIFFSVYFIHKLRFHSYLFMKNFFLNITKIGLFFSNTIILIIAFLFGRDEVVSPLFLLVGISVFLVIMPYLYFIYNPFSYIVIKRETPKENIFFYFYILSEKNEIDFVFENKIKGHYEKCGICNLCRKYLKYTNKYQPKNNLIDEEKETLIIGKSKNYNNDEKNKDKLMDLFEVVYDDDNKYLKLIKKIIINYKIKGKEYFSKNSYYFINLCFLIYSDYQNKNYNLSQNERLILEIMNQENTSFLNNHESQISQIFLCNRFISLSERVLSKLKNILNSEANLIRAKKLIDLSVLLKQLDEPKYKKLFSHKLENISNSRHLILICSVIYEEIFNTLLNNSQLPIRDNIQPLEDIFENNSNKINKLISLAVNVTNNTCKIIRSGKGLHSYINTNLFDLFPLIFKNYQINLFMTNILENFEKKEKEKAKYFRRNSTNISKYNTKIIKVGLKGINNNKNNKDFIEIKLIIAEYIENKMYYKLLTLKLAPLYNNINSYFVFLDGIYYMHKSTLITLKDLEQNKNENERIIAVSEPELDNNNIIYSIAFKKYCTLLNNQCLSISKIFSFNISEKFYNIYLISKKDINKNKVERKISRIKFDDLEELQSSLNKTTKVEKIHLIEENASIGSQQTGSSYNGGISNLGIRNKKKNNIYEYGGFNKIKTINIILIIMAIIILIIEYVILNIFQNNNYNYVVSLFEFTEFSKLYFQLFSSIISVVCFNNNNNKCLNLIDIFVENYKKQNNEEYFDDHELVVSQNILLAEKMMKKRSNLINIHKCIGNEKYNNLFGKKINYYRITQTIFNDKYYYNVISVEMQFSEAILVICNSLQILVQENKNFIFFLEEKAFPFNYINSNSDKNTYLNDYQKNFYEMIFNYKYYYEEFTFINEQLQLEINRKSKLLKIFVYIYLSFDVLLIIFIGSLMYLYTMSFESLLIKIINYINMIMNIKNDDYNFVHIFSQKIENLETILQFYNFDPIKSVQNLNSIYGGYQQYLTLKNKNNAIDANKKNYVKIIENDKKNELDNIPNNQSIINRTDVRSLGITFIYIFVFYFVSVVILVFYILLIVLWTDYFTKKSKLSTLNKKNNKLEMALYRAINSYHIMMANGFSFSEVSELVLSGESKRHGPNSLFIDFYENLKFAFNGKREKKRISKIYQDIEDKGGFTCQNIYELNKEFLFELENYTEGINLLNIKNHLVGICENTKVTESKDYRTIFERHFQYIKNAMSLIDNISIDDLITHITSDDRASKISLFFDYVIIYIVEIAYYIPYQDSIVKLNNILKRLIQMSELIFLFLYITSILFITILFIPGINNLCNQIFTLKKVFKIFEMHE